MVRAPTSRSGNCGISLSPLGPPKGVIEGGRSIPDVAQDLDLTESALRAWVHKAGVDAGRGRPGELTTAEREELQRLRREVKTLRLEREILKKAAVSSGGRRNSDGEFISWRDKAECLARTTIESTSDRIQPSLRVDREVGAFGEVLPQEAVRVLVGASLPRASGVAEIDCHVGGHGK